MQYYVLDYNLSKADHLLDLFERSTHMLEKYFGEYPWGRKKLRLPKHRTWNGTSDHDCLWK
jgi:aminopeptidase N